MIAWIPSPRSALPLSGTVEPLDADADLLRAWAGGDRTAGNTLFRRHFDALFRFLSTKLDGPCDDLVQETFEACLAGAARFEGRASFRTYMLRIARNRLCEHYRRARRDFSPQSASVSSGASGRGSRRSGAEDAATRILAVRGLWEEEKI